MRLIPLSQGKFSPVDDEDYDRLMAMGPWCFARIHGHEYAIRRDRITKRTIYMHRVILDPTPFEQIDHVDNDGINNQRHNLRIATPSQNQCNRGPTKNNKSGVKGVSWVKNRKKWRGRVKLNGVAHDFYSVNFNEVVDFVYRVAIELHGEFARPG